MQPPIQDKYWKSKWGFVLAAMSSAIGLANIWRFPFLVGQYGGGAFLTVYLLCLAFAGLPIFILETLIGRDSGSSAASAMYELSRRYYWSWAGKLLVFTAFLVSAYYCVIAGWVMGYWVQSVTGELLFLQTIREAGNHFNSSIASLNFACLWPQLFLAISCAVVGCGVQAGLERASKFFMPLIFILLFFLVSWCWTEHEAGSVLRAMFEPRWEQLTPAGVQAALGQSFFTLSLGQGTMISYGSYLKRGERILPLAILVVLADTFISLLATWVVFSACFQGGVSLDAGPGLVFQSLPVLFNAFHSGPVLAFIFFSLLLLATLTSQISVIEPVVSWLAVRFGRLKALLLAMSAIAIATLPAGFCYRGVSLGWWQEPSMLWNYDILCTRLLIPLGGILAVTFIHQGWGFSNLMRSIERTELHSMGFADTLSKRVVRSYFSFCFKWATPILITVVFLHSLYGEK